MLHEEAALIPDNEGILLSPGRPQFASRNGRYVLTLGAKGDIVLSRNETELHPLWWTKTGDGRGEHRLVVEKTEDRLRIAVKANVHDGIWDTFWHSDLEPTCRHAHVAEKAPSGQLRLSNRGKLSIDKVCDLYIPMQDREQERSLAVIMTGLYRTNHIACKSHMANLITSHPSFTRIDVFAYVLYEEDDITRGRTRESIMDSLRDCYGDSLRTLDVVARKDEDVEYPGGDEAMLAPCGGKLRRLNNQLGTISAAAQKWWAWSVAEGYTHDTILRIRPDTDLRSTPNFWSLKDLRDDTLVLPHPAGEHYFYCSQMDGRVSVGPSDQIAYGSATAMGYWLHMYRSFAQMVDLAANPDRPAYRSFAGCEELPSGPLEADCARPAPCSIECLVAWYLNARDIKFNVEWNWDQGLLRWGSVDGT